MLSMITIDEVIASVVREIAMRERVYAKWIDTGRMTKAKADHEIACMKKARDLLMQMKADAPVGQ
jgi:hypothetical protein